MVIVQSYIAGLDKRYIGWGTSLAFLLIALLVEITYGQEEKFHITINNNDYIEIVSYDKPHCSSLEEWKQKFPIISSIPAVDSLLSCSIKVLYKAKKDIFLRRNDDNRIINSDHRIIVDCFDSNEKQMKGYSSPALSGTDTQLAMGEVREITLGCPKNTTSFNLRVYSRHWATTY